jgi:hypothetical protein
MESRYCVRVLRTAVLRTAVLRTAGYCVRQGTAHGGTAYGRVLSTARVLRTAGYCVRQGAAHGRVLRQPDGISCVPGNHDGIDVSAERPFSAVDQRHYVGDDAARLPPACGLSTVNDEAMLQSSLPALQAPLQNGRSVRLRRGKCRFLPLGKRGFQSAVRGKTGYGETWHGRCMREGVFDPI